MARALSKRARLARQKFHERVTNYLTALGAVPDTFYQFQIPTKAGVLRISPYDTWIATRFDEPDRARQLLGDSVHARLNPHSGKWNFHFSQEELQRPFVLADFQHCLERLLPAACVQSDNSNREKTHGPLSGQV